MKNNYTLINFEVKDKEYIERTLEAFCMNFKEGITIYKRVGYYKGDITYKIYIGNLNDTQSHEYIYQVDNIDELKGWLYGMVQANNGYMKLFKGEL
ncbi:MAG: hypothetical protein IJO32_07990 [Bacilli bacterium]|nr:hypothetical protein [Bacilli bacterium]